MDGFKWNGERLPYLDFLRGVAVLGLLFMNLPHMGLFELGYVNHTPALFSDQVADGVKAVFLDGRFRSLFCLLFGIGLYLQSQSYQMKGLQHKAILKSRIGWLLVFGFIHCVFIWPGDILIMYALCGYYLYERLDYSAEKLWRRGRLFFLIGIVLMLAMTLLVSIAEETPTRDSESFTQAYEMLTSGYGTYVIQNLMVAGATVLLFLLFALWSLGGVMLIGIALFKSGKLVNGFTGKEVVFLLTATILVSAIDIYTSLYVTWFRDELGFFGSISGLTMALLIWQLVLKTKVYAKSNFLVTSVKRVGGMALSFYIFQSLVMTTVFRVLYPEWNLSFTQIDYLLLALAFILLQLIIAYVYKGIFNQGPLEYLWRKLVSKKVAEVAAQEQAKA